MEPDRRQRLEALPGWSWDALSDQWEEGFSHLKEFSEREGHCRVPAKLQNRRWLMGSVIGSANKERKRTQWNLIVGNAWRHCRVGHGIPIRTNGKKGFSHLKAVFRTRGSLPSACKLQDRRWLSARSVGCSIREQLRTTMDPDRRQRLEALPGWSWDALSDQWEEGFSHLKEFSEREGHCRVVQGYKTDDGLSARSWVSNQREKKDTMEPDRRQRLEALPGWSWDPHSDQWEEGLLSSEAVFRTRGALPSAQRLQDRRRLSAWSVGCSSKKQLRTKWTLIVGNA